MQVLIVEDEEMAAKKLVKTLAAAVPEAQVAGMTSSIDETVVWLQAHPAPELILMDIELADGQSFRVFEKTEVKSTVIFTTSYDEYAIKAFKVNSVDYLLKPIQQNELRAAVDKFNRVRNLHQQDGRGAEHAVDISSLITSLNKMQTKEYRQRFLVQYMHKMVSININDIAYFYSDNRLTLIRANDGRRMVVEYTLDELEQMLDMARFFRVSRAFLISADCVEHVENYFGNRLAVRLQPVIDKEVIVSREKITPFKLWLGK
ncbi:LytR/AlgR family response regulator transcription factor [Hymenobacter jeollabukensis]|uniref:Response regulator transcription factor n=1 Tax=Hymenobacter jeollabukensis TaxID=2025313 RepID=A0A5R8WJQ7_9BACT|nr:LytTR family DNA-binding domain-containing protein [Hymenobacter jeollabukensis]TLM88920.1 response regulator transcription factor [Hymenobacter jeollabukensis]